MTSAYPVPTRIIEGIRVTRSLLSATCKAILITSLTIASIGQTPDSISIKEPADDSALSSTTSTLGATPIATGRLIFLPQVTSSVGKNLTGSAPSGALADFNADGKLDLVLVAVDRLDTVTVRFGNGDETFQAPHSYNTGLSGAQAVTIADLNEDGKLDLIVTGCGVTCSPADVAVLLGNGDGSFKPAVLYDTGGSLSAAPVAVGDVNLDGKPDLVILNACGNTSCSVFGTVGVLLGRGDGTFRPLLTHTTGGFGSSSIAIADLNGDGNPDLVVTNDCGRQGCTTYDQSHQIAVLLGNGDGTFQPLVGYPSGGLGTSSLIVLDINGDSNLDVAVLTRCTPSCSSGSHSSVGVLLGNGDGTFQSPTSYDSGGILVRGLTAIDANGDGKRDLIMTGFCDESSADCTRTLANIFALLGNGDGTLQPALILYMLGAYGGPESLLSADLNNDGKPDLILLHGCNLLICPVNDVEVGVMLNNRGALAIAVSLASSKNPVSLYQTVTYTAKLADGSSGTLNGTVTFADGANPVKTVTLSGNQATYSTTYKTAASHHITATYSGVFHMNGGRRSLALTENVVNPSRTVLATSESPSFIGQPVTFTATVTSNNGAIPAGELMKFFDGSTLLASVELSGGKATFITSKLTARSHGIKAVYVGDTTFATSTGFLNQVVELYPTATALTCRPNPSSFGQVVTMTATVKSAGPLTPTGKVAFTDGTTWIGAGTLSGGAATISKSNLAVGTHAIKARYSSDSNSASSTSALVNEVVK